MNFAFSSDQQLLKNSARAFLDEHMTPATVRLLWDDPRGESETLWKEMGELGWLGLSLPEAHGGSGLGMVETAILLEEMGRAAVPGPYLPTVLAARAIEESGTDGQRKRWLSAIATGEARATLAFLDADLDWRPEGTRTRAEKSATGWTLSGTKRFVPWAHVADVLLVPARTPDGLTLFLVDPAAAGLTLEPAQVMDGATRLVTVTLDATPVGGDGVLGAAGQAGPVLASLLRRGAVGAAAEMLGAARRCLDMAVGYAKVREQFGQPIGSFQAIRHKCSEMLLEVENSHSAVYYAAWALDAKAEDAELAASVAKAYVGDASRKVCGEAIQVHGGIGFTWEYDLHIYFKRAKALEPMYGDADYHREQIVRRVASLPETARPRARDPAPARRHPGRRSHELHRRLVRRDAARRSRSGGHQGRGARGRLVPRIARLLRMESGQALDRGQPEDPRGARDRPPARGARRRRDGEHAARRGRAARDRLRATQRDQFPPDLLLGHGVRLERSRLRPTRLRSDLPVAGRPDDAPGLRRAAPVPAHGPDRLLHGGARGPGDRRRALRARAHGPRPARRDVAAPRRHGAPVGRRRGLSGEADADPRQPHLPALPGGRRGLVLPRGRQSGLLGEALQGARPRAPGGRSPLRLVAQAPRAQPGAPAAHRRQVQVRAAPPLARAARDARHPGGAGANR